MVSLPEPTKEEVFEFLDKLRDSGVTNMFGAASGYIESEFHLEHEKAWEFLSAWMECERCAREIRTVQELRGHQTIESPAFGFTGEDLYRGWTLSSSHSIAIIGAIIGGGIGGYLGIFCVWFLFWLPLYSPFRFCRWRTWWGHGLRHSPPQRLGQQKSQPLERLLGPFRLMLLGPHRQPDFLVGHVCSFCLKIKNSQL